MKINKTVIEIEMAERMMTVAETAEKSGVSKPTIYRILSGLEVSPRTVGRISRGLGISVKELIGGV